jgi:tetratricopeptide (TPR) repeat protein
LTQFNGAGKMESFFKKKSAVVSNETDKSQKEKVDKKPKLAGLIDWLIKIPLYLVVIFLPLAFYSKTPSVFELNKQTLLIFLVGVSALAWIGKMAWKNEIRFKKSFLLLPVVLFLFVYGLSAIFSDYFEQSMWGYFGGEGDALASVLFLVIFFILIFNNVKNHQEIFKFVLAFLLSGVILVLLSVLQFFNVYLLPFDFAQTFSFTPLGSIYVYSIFVGLVFLISVTLFLSKINKLVKTFLIVLSVLAFFLLMVINFKVVWLMIILGLALILGIVILVEDKKPSQLRILPMIFLALAVVFVLRSKPIFNKDLPTEIFLKHKTAGEITLKSLKDNPILGSGPAMFENVYKKNRPDNLGDFASVDFSRSTSFFWTMAATTGIVGIISFLFLVVAGIVLVFKEFLLIINKAKDQAENSFLNYLRISIGLGWLFLTAFLFLYFANLTILMLWWFFLALLVAGSFLGVKDSSKEIATTSSGPKTSFFLSFGFILAIIGLISVIYLHSQKYVAAIYFNQAVASFGEENQTQKVADKISRAVALDSNRDAYYRDLAMVHLALAKEKISQEGLDQLSPEASNFISNRFRNALQSLQQAVELNSANSVNYVSLANLYEEFIVIQKNSADKAIENYEKAIELDPKNLDLYRAIANVEITLADLESLENNQGQQTPVKISAKAQEFLVSAEDYIKKALDIDSEYLAGNLLLVTIYEKRGDFDGAIKKSKENIEMYPGYAELQMDLGRIYYQQENLDEGEGYLRTAIKMNNQYSNARYLLGLVLDKKGEKEEALAEFKKIKEFNPENELLDQIIDNLEDGKEALAGLGEEAGQQVQESLEVEDVEEEEVGSEIENQEEGETEAPEEPSDKDEELFEEE